jgi:hypothetical protein
VTVIFAWLGLPLPPAIHGACGYVIGSMPSF